MDRRNDIEMLGDEAAASRGSRFPLDLRVVLDVGERVFAILLSVPFLWAFAIAFSAHPTFILITMSEMVGVFFLLIRRGGLMASTPLAVGVAFAGTALPLLVRPNGIALVPTFVSTSFMLTGLCLSIASKLYLNRSFGLIAANRGVKSRGPYRFVRHPMYLGYIVSQVGYLLASFTPANILCYLFAWGLQILRVCEEETVLRQDPAYREFSNRVRSRLIPHVY